jgi:hypothetical protein
MRVCTICSHPENRAITAELLNGKSYGIVARCYGLSKTAIERHLRLHVSEALRKLAAQQVTVGDAIAIAEPVLSEMRKLNVRAMAILTEAEKAKDLPTALQAIREIRRNFELVAKLNGELDPRSGGETGSGPINVTIQYNRAVVVAPEDRKPENGIPQITAGEA